MDWTIPVTKVTKSNGWGIPAWNVITLMNGTDRELMLRRLALATELLSTTASAPLDGAVIDAVADEVPGRRVLIVARRPEVRARLSQTDRLAVVFESDAAVVFDARVP